MLSAAPRRAHLHLPRAVLAFVPLLLLLLPGSIQAEEFLISLDQGWNFVSLPHYASEMTTAQDLCDLSGATRVAKFDPLTGAMWVRDCGSAPGVCADWPGTCSGNPSVGCNVGPTDFMNFPFADCTPTLGTCNPGATQQEPACSDCFCFDPTEHDALWIEVASNWFWSLSGGEVKTPISLDGPGPSSLSGSNQVSLPFDEPWGDAYGLITAIVPPPASVSRFVQATGAFQSYTGFAGTAFALVPGEGVVIQMVADGSVPEVAVPPIVSADSGTYTVTGTVALNTFAWELRNGAGDVVPGCSSLAEPVLLPKTPTGLAQTLTLAISGCGVSTTYVSGPSFSIDLAGGHTLFLGEERIACSVDAAGCSFNPTVYYQDDLDLKIGACCTGTTCQMLTEQNCLAVGSFKGVGVGCTDTTCGQASTCVDQAVALPCRPGNCPGACDNCGGAVAYSDPVYLFSGEFYLRSEDLRLPGRGFDFTWTRNYRSKTGDNARAGQGWDTSYDIRIMAAATTAPGEATGLLWGNLTTFDWEPPVEPGGFYDDLRYCTVRSNDFTDFVDPAKASVIDYQGADPQTVDPVIPAPGELFNYLIRAKNGTGEGTLGTRSDGVERVGLGCGVAGPNLILDNGSGRRDNYLFQPDGTWRHDEAFEVFTRNPDRSFILRFSDGGSWRFAPLDGSAISGRLIAITDRNGNSQGFAYDAFGRLQTITDTLGHPVTLAYNGDGFVETVTDHTGREVRYEYYDGIEPGGAWGDLKSVTRPAVTGTSTSNDFPDGKTTIYTYSTGFADDRLNHNLLTATDPRGVVYVENTYAATTDPLDLEFDRVVSQRLGGQPTEMIYSYAELTPGPANNGAVALTIVNDRVGHVKEFYFDTANRNVMLREYTGEADPFMPTTQVDNRPFGGARPGFDPPYFEKRWEYNDDSRPTRIVYPNLSEETFVYDETNPDRRAQGNMLQQCRNVGPNSGSTPQICENFEYDVPAGNFVSRHTNGRLLDTWHFYDGAGNRMQTVHRDPSIVEDFEYNPFGQMTAREFPEDDFGNRRRDEYDYGTFGNEFGRLETISRDISGFALTTQYGYDPVGNVIAIVDPMLQDTLYEFNQLDQLVRTTSREIELGFGIRYSTAFHYDAADNLVRVDRDNIDEFGTPRSNGVLTSIIEYDSLNRIIAGCRESGDYTGPIPDGGICAESGERCDQFPTDPANCPVGPNTCLFTGAPTCLGLPDSEFIFNEYEYDASDNLIRLRPGEAANGNQPEAELALEYDERDLLFWLVRGDSSLEPSSTFHDYDLNGNLIRRNSGTEGVSRLYEYVWDGYDRLESTLDPMGNEILYGYDERHNLTSFTVNGEVTDVAGSSGNITLAGAIYQYDSMDRRFLREVSHFDTASGMPIGDGVAETVYDYDGVSQLLRVHDDRGEVTHYEYDSIHRRQALVDAKGNRIDYLRDGNSNVVTIVETHLSDLPEPSEMFTTNYSYDGLDRRIRVENNLGEVVDFGYDSRDNLVQFEDALRAAPPAPGNLTRYSYDGLDRRIETIRELTDDGTGSGAVIDLIVTTMVWDDSSRLVARLDDHGNATMYEYDPLNRLVRKQYADMTERLYEYDVHDNLLREEDANGTVVDNGYDLLDRLTSRTVTRGIDVLGTTSESYEYDGLSRLVLAVDDDATVTRDYDSMSNLAEEQINGTGTQFTYDGVGSQLQTVYPGGRTVDRTYDPLYRVESIDDLSAGSIADYYYIGPRRVAFRDYGNNSSTDYGYDGLGRLVELQTTVPFPPFDVDHRTFHWDPMSNKIEHDDIRPGGLATEIDYVYDSAYRLIDSSRVVAPGPPDPISYAYDGVGNRTSVTGNTDPGTYVMDPTMPDPADDLMNQYTQTPFDDRFYDANGNTSVTDDPVPGQREHSYDFANRLVQIDDPFNGLTLNYSYDPLGRRIESQTPLVTRYFYDGDRVIEEQDFGGVTMATYVHGNYIDELLQMERGGQVYYFHHDDQYSVVAATRSTGLPWERYEYGDFGEPRFFNPVGGPLTGSNIGNPYLFTGRRWDDESGLYYFRSRYLDPRAGRFLTHDGIGDWGDPANLGSGVVYAGNNPATLLDPSGHGVYPTDFAGASVTGGSGGIYPPSDPTDWWPPGYGSIRAPWHDGPDAVVVGELLDERGDARVSEQATAVSIGGGPWAEPLGVYPTDFAGASYGNPSGIDWDFGDGADNSTSKSPIHDGPDPDGCKYGNPSGIDWDFGDGASNSTSMSPIHVGPRTGGCDDGDPSGVDWDLGDTKVNASSSSPGAQRPNPDVMAWLASWFGGGFGGQVSQTLGVYPVDFSGASYGQPSGVEWDFGDGEENTTTMTPIHNELTPIGGNYGQPSGVEWDFGDGEENTTSMTP